MKTLRHICQTFVEWIKQICTLPALVAKALKQHKHQAGLNVLEAERLDRIRNPEKYRGK
jgi:hypothetical protein